MMMTIILYAAAAAVAGRDPARPDQQDNATPFCSNAHVLIRLNSDYHIYTLYASAKVAC